MTTFPDLLRTDRKPSEARCEAEVLVQDRRLTVEQMETLRRYPDHALMTARRLRFSRGQQIIKEARE